MVTPTRACDQARSFVSLRLDDELSELERALLDAHLDACAVCRGYAVDVAAATSELRGAPLEWLERPISLPLTRRRYLRSLQTAAAGAVAAAAVVAGVVGVTPAVVGDSPTEVRPANIVEPVSPRRELQLYDAGSPTEGPAGTIIPI